jgi:hypothetical protein
VPVTVLTDPGVSEQSGMVAGLCGFAAGGRGRRDTVCLLTRAAAGEAETGPRACCIVDSQHWMSWVFPFCRSSKRIFEMLEPGTTRA